MIGVGVHLYYIRYVIYNVSEYGKRGLMAQKKLFFCFFLILVPSYFTILELQNKLLSVSLPKRKAKL